MKILATLLLTMIGMIAISCSLFVQIVTIEVPPSYTGWCYVISVKDTSGLNIKKKGKVFFIDQNGVAYIPATELSLKKDSKIIIMQGGVDISGQERYAGSVYKNMHNGKTYDYIHFYIPEQQERNIKEGQYWRDNRYKYTQRDKFDSLIIAGAIKFQ